MLDRKECRMTENELSKVILDCAFKVHSILGPGLLESVYEAALAFELENEGLSIERQKGIPVVYSEVKLELGFRADIIVENKVIIEIKSVESLADVHFKQLLSYLRLTNLKLGLLLNFNESLLKNGLKRVVNNL
jgi:GxxExxY protein